MLGLVLTLHDYIPAADEQKLIDALTTWIREGGEKVALAISFFSLWCKFGRPLSMATLTNWKELLLQSFPDTADRAASLAPVEEALLNFSPVLGRWRAQFSPRSNIFVWMSWDARTIAVALTSMCLPFYRLRACEFNEKNPGKHLKDLNLRYNSISMFVTTSVLLAAVLSKADGVRALDKWLETAEVLHEMHNYHMLFAIQNALHKHQLDRLTFLFRKISSKSKKTLKTIDNLFSTTDRMRVFKEELAAAVGVTPAIPCVFWLVQKGVLLQEAPLRDNDGKLNRTRIESAVKIFADLEQLQKKRYAPLREDEQVLWYLMRLERDELTTEEELYTLSDAAKKLAKRIQVSTTKRSIGQTLFGRKSSNAATSSAAVSSSPTKSTFGRKVSVPAIPTQPAAGERADRKGSTSASPAGSREGDTSTSNEMSDEMDEEAGEAVIKDIHSLESIVQIAKNAMNGQSDKQYIGAVSALF